MVLGVVIRLSLRDRSERLREPFGVMQAALLGFMGLILAFGLSLAVGRYEDRRAATVSDANAIGTAYLRAQTLAEPIRSSSLALLVTYTDTSIRLADSVPDSPASKSAIADGGQIQRRLWTLAGQALVGAPVASAPRLYVESLNDMIDMQTTRASALTNRVPSAVLTLEVMGAAVALGLLALYLSVLGRGLLTVSIAAVLVSSILLVTFDLDRPYRGVIRVPDTPLVQLRASMTLPPAATGPGRAATGADGHLFPRRGLVACRGVASSGSLGRRRAHLRAAGGMRPTPLRSK